jgi:hypothetical protein
MVRHQVDDVGGEVPFSAVPFQGQGEPGQGSPSNGARERASLGSGRNSGRSRLEDLGDEFINFGVLEFPIGWYIVHETNLEERGVKFPKLPS